MQDLLGLAIADFDERAHAVIGKVEVDSDGIGTFQELPDVKDLRVSSNIINVVSMLSANSFSVTCLNTNNRFSWKDAGAANYNWLRQGRKIRLYAGIKLGSTNYHWRWITGRIDAPQFSEEAGVEICTITGRCFMSALINNSPKQSYWGFQKRFDTTDGQDEYEMPVSCTGVYRAFIDSIYPYDGTRIKEIRENVDWTYDWTTNKFLLLRSIIPYYSGTNNLIIYYFTSQVVERVIADILVDADVLRLYEYEAWYVNSAFVTPTGKQISRVWFRKGTSCLEAARLVAEVVRYRFYLDQIGNPIFKPMPSKQVIVSSIYSRDVTIKDIGEAVEEVRNHIIVTGEERKKLVKIPTVATQFPVTRQSAVAVTMWGTIDAVGSGNIYKRGFQWGIGQQTTSTYTESGSFGVGDYSHEVINLTPGTDYFYRAWVKNPQGMFIGKWQNYKTTVAVAPTVITDSVSDITSTTAKIHGNIYNIGGQNCWRRGFKYGKTEVDTWTEVEYGSFGTGIFDLVITGLEPDTTYFVRAVGKNGVAEGFGDYIEFQTLA